MNIWDEWFYKYGYWTVKLHKILWKNYLRILNGIDLNNPNILELGCGSGMMTYCLLKKYGGKATVVDYSDGAINLSKRNLRQKPVRFIKEGVLSLNLKREFDLVHSQGLIEHFKGKQQIKVIEKHVEFLKKGGFLIILAPRACLGYRLSTIFYKMINLGTCPFGYEKPIDPEKLKQTLQGFGLILTNEKNSFVEYSGLWAK